jgi:glutamate dehydrogenase/leucine dehydrogenase
VGAWAADILADHGGKVTAVSDVNAAMVNEGGLDIKALRHHLAKGERLLVSPLPQNTQTLVPLTHHWQVNKGGLDVRCCVTTLPRMGP